MLTGKIISAIQPYVYYADRIGEIFEIHGSVLNSYIMKIDGEYKQVNKNDVQIYG